MVWWWCEGLGGKGGGGGAWAGKRDLLAWWVALWVVVGWWLGVEELHARGVEQHLG